MSRRIKGVGIALAIHAVVYGLAVHPMATIQSEAGLGFIVPATILYFPISLLAWILAMGAHSTEAFTGTLLVAGGIWYGFLGFWVGRKLDRKH